MLMDLCGTKRSIVNPGDYKVKGQKTGKMERLEEEHIWHLSKTKSFILYIYIYIHIYIYIYVYIYIYTKF
jgi:hypothetical protein